MLTAVGIAADTVVILGGTNPAILEKPSSKGDQLDMLESYRGADVRVATGVTLGETLFVSGLTHSCGTRTEISPLIAVQPQLATPGYSCTSLVVTSKVSAVTTRTSSRSLTDTVSEGQVVFAENSPTLLNAYVESGEGIDRSVESIQQDGVSTSSWLTSFSLQSWRLRDSRHGRPLDRAHRGRLQQHRRLPRSGAGVLAARLSRDHGNALTQESAAGFFQMARRHD
mgnify:CR=1 FL=1